MSFITDFAAQQQTFMDRLSENFSSLSDNSAAINGAILAIHASGETLGPVTTAKLALIQSKINATTASASTVNTPISNSPPVYGVQRVVGSKFQQN